MSRIKSLLNTSYILIKYLFAYVLVNYFSMRLKKKSIWLFLEKKDEARDNAYHLYKYMRENHPEIESYFVITKTSAERNKVVKLGEDRVIDFGSFKHYIYSAAAKYSIGSQPNCAYPAQKISSLKKILKKMPKSIFLQHGIIKNDLSSILSKKNIEVDFFTTSAKREYDDVSSKYGYKNNEAKLVGLCRYDRLLDNSDTENLILLMPTWRTYLTSEKNLETTVYFKQYNSLINNKQIEKILEEYNYKLIFYPHYAMQSKVNLFDKTSERVIIASREKYDVQDLLKRCKILVTDYSSVFFDFAYMKKPVIYYHFDYEEYEKKHYKEGYFTEIKDGFGPVLYTEEEVCDYLNYLVKNNSRMEEKYISRVNDYFAFRDCDNCKRTYEEIIKLT